MKNNYNKHNQKGQALVTLLVFSTIAILVTGTAVAIALANLDSTTTSSLSTQAFTMAETGAENAIRSLLRNSNYSGETLNLNNGTVTITVSGPETKIITVEAELSSIKRTMQVTGSFENNIFTVTDWQEI